MDRGYVNEQIKYLLAENKQLREQLQDEQINHRQTIDTYSDDVGMLKEQLTNLEELCHGENIYHMLDRIALLEKQLAEAEGKVEKIRQVVESYHFELSENIRAALRKALK